MSCVTVNSSYTSFKNVPPSVLCMAIVLSVIEYVKGKTYKKTFMSSFMYENF